MTNQYDSLISMVEAALFSQTERKTENELRDLIRNLRSAMAFDLSDDHLEQMAREIEEKQGIRVGLGAVVDSEDFEPWLDDAKPTIDPFYWERYQKLLLQTGLPRDVVIATDAVTDKILSRLGNPRQHAAWDRRGMVVGHVQSGKTANYTGLICKAADAGYRLVIVIAGIHNNLRNQTQARIDEGFIGRDTGKAQSGKKGGAKHVIGVGHFDSRNTPVSLTNTLRDFNRGTASTNTSEIESYKVPVVLVIKKNYHTLRNLLEWLRDNSARGDLEMIDQPMLLIDDEADNASINTKYGKNAVTTINGQIRDLLNMFHRSCYVGYTATPFANIFVDPDEEDEMFREDLFPRDFIIGLDAPSNYFGPTKVFVDGLPDEGEPIWLRYIRDNEDLLPLKHTIDHELQGIPDSLLKALRTFLIARAIRNIRGQQASHCSMLVNASRFTAVQGRIRTRLHDALERLKNAIRVNAARGAEGLNDPELAALHETWKAEYESELPDWPAIQSRLLDATASAKVVEVNSRANDLDYTKSGDRGQTVIAVGGFSLSRGLTLEGLTVTWFLRNTMMYDTLMQMGRWFGYRAGYEDLCRIWMPTEAIDWYAFIANAADELHDELRSMEKAKATPRMFGLAVRGHPASLLVTARNKMGSGKKVTVRVGLSNKFVETAKISTKPDDLRANIASAKWLISGLGEAGSVMEATQWGHLFTGVPVRLIDGFLSRWRNAEQSVTTSPDPIRRYISARAADELKTWDLLISSLHKGDVDETLGIPIRPTSRFIEPKDLVHEFMSFSGKRMRVASRGVEKAGVDPERASRAEKEYREERNAGPDDKVNYPDSIYRSQRTKGLFILHFIKATPPRDRAAGAEIELIPPDPVVAWGMSLPVSKRSAESVEYVVNTVRYREIFGDDDVDEELEAELEDV